MQVAIRIGSLARLAVGDHEEIPRRGLPSIVARPALLLLFLGILNPFCWNKMRYLNSVSGTQSDAAPVSGGGLRYTRFMWLKIVPFLFLISEL